MARQRGKGWQGDRLRDGTRQRRMFNTKAEAEAWEQGLDTEVKPRLEDVAGVVFLRRWQNGNNVRNVEAHIKELCEFYGYGKHVADITTSEVERLKTHLLLHKGNSRATVNRKLATLSGILDHARRVGYMDRLPEFDYERESAGRLRFLEDWETEEFRLVAKDDPEWLWAFTFLLDTGCRYSEMAPAILRLLDLVPIALFADTKNGTSRSIPLTRGVIAAAKDSPPQMAYDAFHRKFHAYKDRTSMWDDDQVTPHTLRHTCATRLVKAGIPLYTVSKWLGHSSIRTTERYAHLSVSDLGAAALALEAAPSNVNNGTA